MRVNIDITARKQAYFGESSDLPHTSLIYPFLCT
jgi:hypothetical protein